MLTMATYTARHEHTAGGIINSGDIQTTAMFLTSSSIARFSVVGSLEVVKVHSQ